MRSPISYGISKALSQPLEAAPATLLNQGRIKVDNVIVISFPGNAH